MSRTRYKTENIITVVERDRIMRVKRVLFEDKNEDENPQTFQESVIVCPMESLEPTPLISTENLETFKIVDISLKGVDVKNKIFVVKNEVRSYEEENNILYPLLPQEDVNTISSQMPEQKLPVPIEVEKTSYSEMSQEDVLIFPLESLEPYPLLNINNLETAADMCLKDVKISEELLSLNDSDINYENNNDINYRCHEKTNEDIECQLIEKKSEDNITAYYCNKNTDFNNAKEECREEYKVHRKDIIINHEMCDMEEDNECLNEEREQIDEKTTTDKPIKKQNIENCEINKHVDKLQEQSRREITCKDSTENTKISEDKLETKEDTEKSCNKKGKQSSVVKNYSPTRKRQRHPENWKRNIKKKLREAGEEYCSNGKIRKAKVVKPACEKSCKHKCFTKFTEEDRLEIKNQFYNLTDAQKNKFYKEYTQRNTKSRKRTKKADSRRKFSFDYYFLKGNKERVCKKFFCSTLDISVRRIYYFHQKLHEQSLPIPPTPNKGKHVKKQTPVNQIEEVMEHIKSFPVEESHFCRSSTKRQYLSAGLSIAKMYALYIEKCDQPVKENIYRKVFNEKFNLSFHKPKKDVCDLCSEFKANKNPDEEFKQKYADHIKRKEEGNNEREKDRTSNEAATAVVTFDLENIFSLPQAEISCLFYKSKLTVYNLTAHCNIGKHAINATWDETTNGRSGDDIASGLVKILNHLTTTVLPPTVKRLILWSDSCVPQNKNSHMSLAIIQFLKSDKAKNIIEIIQKFSEPGHGNVQEVDNIHSIIERNLRHQEIFSPLSLKRAFLKIQSSKLKFTFLTMTQNDFLSYHEESAKLGFSQIPYSRVKYLSYQKDNWQHITFKTSFQGPQTTVNLRTKTKITVLDTVQIKPSNQTLTQNKIKDIRSAYKYMPEEDKQYMEVLINKVLDKGSNIKVMRKSKRTVTK